MCFVGGIIFTILFIVGMCIYGLHVSVKKTSDDDYI